MPDSIPTIGTAGFCTGCGSRSATVDTCPTDEPQSLYFTIGTFAASVSGLKKDDVHKFRWPDDNHFRLCSIRRSDHVLGR